MFSKRRDCKHNMRVKKNFKNLNTTDLSLLGEKKHCYKLTLREKCPNTEFFLVCIFLYSLRIQKTMDQNKLRIWTHFTQCYVPVTECFGMNLKNFETTKNVHFLLLW